MKKFDKIIDVIIVIMALFITVIYNFKPDVFCNPVPTLLFTIICYLIMINDKLKK